MPDIEGYKWIIEAWQELTTCRPYPMGAVAQIPVTAIWQYADRYEAPPWFTDVILLIDASFVTRVNKQSNNQ